MGHGVHKHSPLEMGIFWESKSLQKISKETKHYNNVFLPLYIFYKGKRALLLNLAYLVLGFFMVSALTIAKKQLTLIVDTISVFGVKCFLGIYIWIGFYVKLNHPYTRMPIHYLSKARRKKAMTNWKNQTISNCHHIWKELFYLSIITWILGI